MKVKEFFNRDFKNYDKVIQARSLNYEQVNDLIINIIELKQKRRIKVLDLGCGSGNLAVRLLKEFQNLDYVGVDFSERLLKITEEKLKKFRKKYKLIRRDFKIFDIKEKFDFIISNAAIHHLRDEEKIKLFKKVYNLLNKSGQFIYADSIKSSNKNVEKDFQKIKNYLRVSKTEEKEKVRSLIKKSRKIDKPATYENILTWLKNLRFRNIDIFYKYLTKIIIVAKK